MKSSKKSLITWADYFILTTINEKYNNLSILHKKLNITYAHSGRVIQKLLKLKLITSKTQGRKHLLFLTKEGTTLKNILLNMNHLLTNEK